MFITWIGTKALVVALSSVAASAVVAPAASEESTRAAAPYPVPYTFAAGLVAQVVAPGASPPGANDFSCRPSRAHPRPVILLHGFSANMTNSWQTASPLLANAGYCVFALTYGTYPRADPTGQLGGLDYIETSARQVAAFVSQVRTSTGASKVDLVGWSLGGWLARFYVQFDGGAKVVRSVVGLAPANGPTNVSQLIFAAARVSPAADRLVSLFHSGLSTLIPLAGQAADPDLFAKLGVNGGTSDNVHYTNIASEYDELVPPSSAFVPTGRHVRNVTVQDGCAVDFSDHLSIVATRRAMQFMVNALDPRHAVRPPCQLVLPVAG